MRPAKLSMFSGSQSHQGMWIHLKRSFSVTNQEKSDVTNGRKKLMSSENRIFVDAARVMGKVEPNIYGFNIEHIHRDQSGSSIIYGAIFD